MPSGPPIESKPEPRSAQGRQEVQIVAAGAGKAQCRLPVVKFGRHRKREKGGRFYFAFNGILVLV